MCVFMVSDMLIMKWTAMQSQQSLLAALYVSLSAYCLFMLFFHMQFSYCCEYIDQISDVVCKTNSVQMNNCNS